MLLLYAWLASITLIDAIFGSRPFRPIDARTDLPVPGVHLEFPVWASLFEPLTSLFHIMETLPDYIAGMVVVLLWIVAGAGLYGLLTARCRGAAWRKANLRGLRYAGLGMLLYVIYLFCTLVSHFPSWELKKDVAGLVAADLHSHSMLSHDGIIPAYKNLLLHRERGYDLVALTDHINEKGPFVSYLAADKKTASALPGVEMPVYYGGHFYLSAVGMDRDTPLPEGLAWMRGRIQPVPYQPGHFPANLWTVQRFIDTVHKHHGMVDVVALNLSPAEVYGLAGEGVDGFEYVNSGRRPLPDDVRQAMLNVQQNLGIGLIVASDWHGWSGALAVWTLVREPTFKRGDLPADIVMRSLKNRDGADITPVVAFPVHRMGWFETIISPLIGVFNYARSLSLEQILSWWMWSGLLTLLMLSDWFEGVSAGRLALRTGLGCASLVLVTDGMMMLVNGMPNELQALFNLKVACSSLGMGLLLMIIAQRISYMPAGHAPLLRLDIERFPYVALVRDEA